MQQITVTPVIGPLRLGMGQPWHVTNDIHQGVMGTSRHSWAQAFSVMPNSWNH